MAPKRKGKRSSQQKAMVRAKPATAEVQRAWRSVAAAARSKYAAPAATAVGLTAAAATGIALRSSIESLTREMARAVVGASRAIVRSLRADAILELVGLQRRRPLLTAALPIAAGATGVLAGSALTMWIATRRARQGGRAATKLNSPSSGPVPAEDSDRSWA